LTSMPKKCENAKYMAKIMSVFAKHCITLPRLAFFLVFSALAFAAFAQSANEIDAILDTNEVTYAQVSYLMLNAAQIRGVSNPGDAFNYAAQRNWLPPNVSMQDRARLDAMALLAMQAFNMPGGVMYSVVKNGSAALAARYAYRELVYLNVIQGRVSPQMRVSGDQLLYIVNSILSREEE